METSLPPTAPLRHRDSFHYPISDGTLRWMKMKPCPLADVHRRSPPSKNSNSLAMIFDQPMPQTLKKMTVRDTVDQCTVTPTRTKTPPSSDSLLLHNIHHLLLLTPPTPAP
mmetsp:Transcript_47413/g.100758  ORF Transcript_47413/g.100758 Transcript_47413/m.100758 type:complete len:111 (-) Transcript_47413:19-351(-)